MPNTEKNEFAPAEFKAEKVEANHDNRFNIPDPGQEELDRKIAFYSEKLESYGYDRRNPKAFDLIAKYFAMYYLGTAKKGLALIGNTGRGKSKAMEIMEKMFNVRMLHSYDMAETWQEYGADRRREFWGWLNGSYVDNSCFGKKYANVDRLCHDAIIDDLGTEPTMAEYGQKQEIQSCIQQKRLNGFMRPQGPFTHYTFNLSIDGAAGDKNSLAARYSPRFVSRLKQMCFIVHLDGKDWRANKYVPKEIKRGE